MTQLDFVKCICYSRVNKCPGRIQRYERDHLRSAIKNSNMFNLMQRKQLDSITFCRTVVHIICFVLLVIMSSTPSWAWWSWKEIPRSGLPDSAFEVGHAENGDRYYLCIGTVHLGGDHTFRTRIAGRVIPSDNYCVIPVGSILQTPDLGSRGFVLVYNNSDPTLFKPEKLHWSRANDGRVPDGAIPTGEGFRLGPKYYVCRAQHGSGLYPGVAEAGRSGVCRIASESGPIDKSEFEFLVGNEHPIPRTCVSEVSLKAEARTRSAWTPFVSTLPFYAMKTRRGTIEAACNATIDEMATELNRKITGRGWSEAACALYGGDDASQIRNVKLVFFTSEISTHRINNSISTGTQTREVDVSTGFDNCPDNPQRNFSALDSNAIVLTKFNFCTAYANWRILVNKWQQLLGGTAPGYTHFSYRNQCYSEFSIVYTIQTSESIYAGLSAWYAGRDIRSQLGEDFPIPSEPTLRVCTTAYTLLRYTLWALLKTHFEHYGRAPTSENVPTSFIQFRSRGFVLTNWEFPDREPGVVGDPQQMFLDYCLRNGEFIGRVAAELDWRIRSVFLDELRKVKLALAIENYPR